MAELDGRVALVTGAGMGIGAACAVALARAGARVMIAEIDPAAGERAAEAIRGAGGEARSVAADVRRMADAEAATAAAVEAWGRLDILVNNAARVVHRRRRCDRRGGVERGDLDQPDLGLAVHEVRRSRRCGGRAAGRSST